MAFKINLSVCSVWKWCLRIFNCSTLLTINNLHEANASTIVSGSEATKPLWGDQIINLECEHAETSHMHPEAQLTWLTCTYLHLESANVKSEINNPPWLIQDMTLHSQGWGGLTKTSHVSRSESRDENTASSDVHKALESRISQQKELDSVSGVTSECSVSVSAACRLGVRVEGSSVRSFNRHTNWNVRKGKNIPTTSPSRQQLRRTSGAHPLSRFSREWRRSSCPDVPSASITPPAFCAVALTLGKFAAYVPPQHWLLRRDEVLGGSEPKQTGRHCHVCTEQWPHGQCGISVWLP